MHPHYIVRFGCAIGDKSCNSKTNVTKESSVVKTETIGQVFQKASTTQQDKSSTGALLSGTLHKRQTDSSSKTIGQLLEVGNSDAKYKVMLENMNTPPGTLIFAVSGSIRYVVEVCLGQFTFIRQLICIILFVWMFFVPSAMNH